MKYFIIFLSCLYSCGEEKFLEPGIYDVAITYTRDDWPGSYVGEVHDVRWKIIENVENAIYKMKVVEEYKRDYDTGYRDNNKIVFHILQVDTHNNCNFVIDVLMELYPHESSEFNGFFNYRVDMGMSSPTECIVAPLYTESTVIGKLHKDE